MPKKTNQGNALQAKLEKLGLEVKLEAKQDDTSVRGNAMCSGDKNFDRKVEDKILSRLEDGDVWAWAVVTVTVRDSRTGLEGYDCLGGCNYKSEADFKRADDYWSDMVSIAYGNLRKLLEDRANPTPDMEAAKRLEELPEKP